MSKKLEPDWPHLSDEDIRQIIEGVAEWMRRDDLHVLCADLTPEQNAALNAKLRREDPEVLTDEKISEVVANFRKVLQDDLRKASQEGLI